MARKRIEEMRQEEMIFLGMARKPKTKEEMKREMLEHNYFDTEILFDGMKNERTDDSKRSEKDLLEEAQVREVIDQIKASGDKEYRIMDVQPGVRKKMQFYRKVVFFFNLPMVVGIPIFVEWGLPSLEKKNASMI